MSSKKEEVVEDFLEVDRAIPGQNFCCLSFISPEKVIKDKEAFVLTQFLNFLISPHDQPQSGHKTRLDELRTGSSDSKISYDAVKEMYDNYRYTNEDQLNKDYDEKTDFRTSVRGVKVRGVYSTQKEAAIRAKVLQRRDKNFHVYVGQVGYWLPWDPNPDKIDAEYNDQDLNKLMKNYKKNQADKEAIYEDLKQQQLKKAQEDNEEKKKTLALQNEVKKKLATNATDATDATDVTDATDATETVPVSEVDSKEVSKDKLDKLREVMNIKDEKYRQIMDKSKPDPWMARKMEDLKKKEKEVKTETTKTETSTTITTETDEDGTTSVTTDTETTTTRTETDSKTETETETE